MFKFDQKLTMLPISPSFSTFSIQKFKNKCTVIRSLISHSRIRRRRSVVPSPQNNTEISIIFQKKYHVFHPFDGSHHQFGVFCIIPKGPESQWKWMWMRKLRECYFLFFVMETIESMRCLLKTLKGYCFDELNRLRAPFAFNWTVYTIWKRITWQYVRVDHITERDDVMTDCCFFIQIDERNIGKDIWTGHHAIYDYPLFCSQVRNGNGLEKGKHFRIVRCDGRFCFVNWFFCNEMFMFHTGRDVVQYFACLLSFIIRSFDPVL